MSKSLSELQSSPDVGPLERVAHVCVAGKLVDDFDRVSAELTECEAQIESLRRDADRRREGGGPPSRLGAPSQLGELEERADQLAAEADGLREKILENSVAVRFRVDDGRWRQWARSHPVRDEQAGEEGKRRFVDPAGYTEDARWGGGICNIAALVSDMRDWIAAYNDEPPSEAWWEFLSRSGAPGDMVKAASTVVGMHVNGVDAGKSRVAWLNGRRSLSDSE